MGRRSSRYSPQETQFDGLPTGSVASLQQDLAELKQSRLGLLTTRSQEQNEFSHIATQFYLLSQSTFELIPQMRSELEATSEFTVLQLSRFRAALDQALSECVQERVVLQKKLASAQRVSFLLRKTALHIKLLLDDTIQIENTLLGVRDAFTRNTLAMQRLGELDRRLSLLNDVEHSIARYQHALVRELAKPETEMDILRARVAEAAKENRDVAARMRSRIPRTERCPYCMVIFGEQDHVDHIVPVAHGGRPLKWNLVRICIPCNLKKRDMTLLEFATKYKLDYLLIASRLQELGKRP